MTTLFPWLADPDWSRGVTETLEWKTDVLQSPTGAEQRISRRLSPRRTFEFTAMLYDTARQRFEHMLWQGCAGTWAMPVYPDVLRCRQRYPVARPRSPFRPPGVTLPSAERCC
jgi:hypothetical protein